VTAEHKEKWRYTQAEPLNINIGHMLLTGESTNRIETYSTL